jgi:hypothetical protein
MKLKRELNKIVIIKCHKPKQGYTVAIDTNFRRHECHIPIPLDEENI